MCVPLLGVILVSAQSMAAEDALNQCLNFALVSETQSEACREAAEQGHADAQFVLGLMYAIGHGVPKDDVQAYAWFNVSGAAEHQQARTNRARLAEGMTPAQIAEAQTLSRHLVGGNP